MVVGSISHFNTINMFVQIVRGRVDKLVTKNKLEKKTIICFLKCIVDRYKIVIHDRKLCFQ